MRVLWVWSKTCDTCNKLDEAGVPADIANVIMGLSRVWWTHKGHDVIGIKDEDPGVTQFPTIKTGDDGRVKPRAVTDTPTGTLHDRTDELYTPCMFLETREHQEQVDIVEYVGADQSSVIEDDPWRVCRSLMRKIFSFYLSHEIETTHHNEIIMQQENSPGSPHHLKPRYEYGEFKPDEWRRAFEKARQVEL